MGRRLAMARLVEGVGEALVGGQHWGWGIVEDHSKAALVNRRLSAYVGRNVEDLDEDHVRHIAAGRRQRPVGEGVLVLDLQDQEDMGALHC